MSRRIGNVEIDEEEHVTLLDRVVLNDGSYLTQAKASAVQIEVVGRDGPVITVNLNPEDVIFDTLQTDGYWQADRIGYNLRYTLDTSRALVGGRQFMVVITVDTYDFGPKYSQWRIKVRDVPTVDTW